jgi:hypothetical protein
MSPPNQIGLPEALERAASALKQDADAIRPANGDPFALLDLLDPEAAVRVLEWLLVNEPSAGSELAGEWADAGGDAAEPLKQISIEGLPKLARKALKRAHHRLRSRGELIPESKQGAVVAKLPVVKDELAAALVSVVDARGTRVAYLVEPHPMGGARLIVAALNESLGVVEFDVFNSGRSKIKQFIRDTTGRKEYPAVAAPIPSVQALISRIADYHPSDRPFPRSFSDWRSRIRPAAGSKTPGELARAELSEPEDPQPAIERVTELVSDRKLGPWPTASEILQPIAESLGEASTGVLIVSPTARQEQVDLTLDEAIDTVFDETFAGRTAERFEESAYFYWKLDQVDDATACLVAATAFRTQAPSLRPIGRAMLEVILAPVLENAGSAEEQQGESDSLLAKP